MAKRRTKDTHPVDVGGSVTVKNSNGEYVVTGHEFSDQPYYALKPAIGSGAASVRNEYVRNCSPVALVLDLDANGWPRSWTLAEMAIRHSPSVLLHGLPGTGKSFAALQRDHPAGAVAIEDVYALTLHDDAAVSDLVGGYLPIAGEWTWRDGPAVQAWRVSHDRPVRIVLNELDRAAGPVHTALLAILDSPETARLTLPTGETVTPNPANLQVVSTMNGIPADLDAALFDRHIAQVCCDEPHPNSIGALPERFQPVARAMSAPLARRAGRGTTPRDWHALARLAANGVNEKDAAEMVWADRGADVLSHVLANTAPAPEALEALVVTPEYRCHECSAFFAESPDGDGDVCCSECGEYSDAAEARANAAEHSHEFVA